MITDRPHYLQHTYGNVDVAVSNANSMYEEGYKMFKMIGDDPAKPVVVIFERLPRIELNDPDKGSSDHAVIRAALSKLTAREKLLLFQ